MNGWLFILLVLILLELVGGITRVGKPRDPLTPRQAAAAVVEWLVIAALAVLAVNA